MPVNKETIDFLNKNNIEWFPINLKLVKNEDTHRTDKILLDIDHELYAHNKINSKTNEQYISYKPECNDFRDLTHETIQLRQGLLDNPKYSFSHIVTSTILVQQIDIDTEENTDAFLKIAEKSPFYTSSTKSYGKHIFITHDCESQKQRIQFTTKEVELLNNGWSYMPIDAKIFNADLPIYHYKDITNDLTISKCIKVEKQDFELKLPKMDTSYKAKEIKAHCDNIAIEYIDNYESWTRLVWALKSIDDEKNAIEMSKRSSKYNEKDFYKVWNGTMTSISIGTLMYFSKLSNAENYSNIKSSNLEQIVEDAVNHGTSEYINKMFYEIYKEDFVYVEDDKMKYHYHYNGVLWKHGKYAIEKAFTSKSFMSYFLKFAAQQNYKFANTEIEEEGQRYLTLGKKAQDLAIDISKSKRVTEFLGGIPKYFHKDDIIFEQNPNIFCFKNAVYDLDQMKFITTPVRDDYMTLSTGYDYRCPTQKEMDTLKDMFEKIFPDKGVRKLYLTILATQLYGATLEKFVMANGKGRNGKGFTNELMIHMLGDYGIEGKNACLIDPIKMGGTPELSMLDNKRGVIFREPSTGFTINSSTVKELTGGSNLAVRALYSNNCKIALKATIILECNKRPNFSDDVDDAMLKRFIDIPFVAEFVENPQDVDETKHIYLGNDDVKKLDFKQNHSCALFHILLDYWKDYKANGMRLEVPDSIKQRAKDHLIDSTPVLAMLAEKYIETTDSTKYVTIDTLFNQFKLTDNYNLMTKAEKRDVTKKAFNEFCKVNPITCKRFRERMKVNGKELTNLLTNYIEKPKEHEKEEE
jgi:phage/plasmid-associated DNA primase